MEAAAMPTKNKEGHETGPRSFRYDVGGASLIFPVPARVLTAAAPERGGDDVGLALDVDVDGGRDSKRRHCDDLVVDDGRGIHTLLQSRREQIIVPVARIKKV
jgi:hypothetical protein